ncbi:MAG: DUF1972 domain-containing protein [Erythrobacter sp.]
MSGRIAILGTVGVPANYGGFETLAENLVAFHEDQNVAVDLTVYCSAKGFDQHLPTYRRAELRYIGFDANGIQSIPYDIVCLLDAVRSGHDRLLLLGVSGAILLPLLRLVTKAKIITNIDGIEWQREKWRGLAKYYLRFAEWAAVRFSHRVIADNQAIADYVEKTYGLRAEVIPYGGDHAIEAAPDEAATDRLPKGYALALCRIEPENNIAMILEAFDTLEMPLVFVGNWDKSEYGRSLKARYANHPTITIHEPVYEAHSLRAIRDGAALYVHGHSAGGTNPSLVEMMHFDIPVAAHGCSFNCHTTEGKALYFESAAELRDRVAEITPVQAEAQGSDLSIGMGAAMGEIARRRYTWEQIGRSYFELLEQQT